MEIETINKIVKLKNKEYRLEFDTGRKIVVHEDVLVKEQLFKGTQMTENFINRIEKLQKKELLYQKALYYLNYKMRTVHEMKKYLLDKEASEEDAEQIVNDLLTKGYLNDENYAKQYTAMQLRLKEKGPFQIKQALLKKGIAEDIINKELEKIDSDDIYQNAFKLAEKSQKKYRNKTEKEARQKIMQRLVNKGYSYEVAKEAVSNLEFEYDEDKEWEQLVKLGDKYWDRAWKYETYIKKEKVKQKLYQKGYNYDLILEFIDQKLSEEE